MKTQLLQAIKQNKGNSTVEYNWYNEEMEIASAIYKNSSNNKQIKCLIRKEENSVTILVNENSYSQSYFKNKIREQLKLDNLYSNKLKFIESVRPGSIIVVRVTFDNPEQITELRSGSKYASIDEKPLCGENYLYQSYNVDFQGEEESYCYGAGGNEGPFLYAKYLVQGLINYL